MPRVHKQPLKLTGHINWGWETADDVIGVVVQRAFMRTPDEIILECEDDGYQYHVSLNRDFGERFHGAFEGRKGNAKSPVVAFCVLYSNKNGYFLFGEWQEDGYDLRWWAELAAVERFADEKRE